MRHPRFQASWALPVTPPKPLVKPRTLREGCIDVATGIALVFLGTAAACAFMGEGDLAISAVLAMGVFVLAGLTMAWFA